MNPKFDPSRYNFPSSGDEQKDAETAARIRKQTANEAEGLCPNGCAPLEWEPGSRYECFCPKCVFRGHGYDIADYPQGAK